MSVEAVVSVLSEMHRMPDNARAVHRFAAAALRRAGFQVEVEVWIEYGDALGRLDIVAELDGARTAIEIDRKAPRAKSIDKLLAFDGGRVLAVRGDAGTRPKGIDAIVGIEISKTKGVRR